MSAESEAKGTLFLPVGGFDYFLIRKTDAIANRIIKTEVIKQI
jgi:hypothetical protein